MFSIKNTLFTLENIEQIVLKRVGKDTFAITIKSNITSNDNVIYNSTIEAGYCKLDSQLHICVEDDIVTGDLLGQFVRSHTVSIPMNIRMLTDVKSGEVFNIKTDGEEK